MRIKINDKIYHLKKIESGVDSLMELVEEPRYKDGNFFIAPNSLAFIFDREGKKGEAHYLFAIDLNDIRRKYIQDAGESAYCGNIKDCTIADQKAIKIIHYGLESIGKRWNAETMEIEDILKNGDLAIFWDEFKTLAGIKIYDRKDNNYYCDSSGTYWKNAIKFESKEQFEKVLRGEI